MKCLYLLRHAKSAWDNADMCDFERPLSKRGNRNAEAMGRALAERGVRADAVFSSSSARTRETLEIISPLIGFPFRDIGFEDILYLAPRETLLNFILHLDDGLDHVLLCGHNPGIGETARLFLRGKADDFPACAFLEIRFAGDSWRRAGPDTVKKKFFLTPRMLDAGND